MMPHDTISTSSLPIYIIGAGGIVNTAHLPAYAIAGYQVRGIFDVDMEKSAATAQCFHIPSILSSVDELISRLNGNEVIDIALPADAVEPILAALPDGCNVLLQKPVGEDLETATRIARLVKSKNMLAAVNFQLRYAPAIREVRAMLASGELGQLLDIEVNINVYTPWHLWNFLFHRPRVEILYHSIHYIDLARSFFGDPRSVYAKTTGHPGMPELSSVKSNIIMDYGDMQRGNILTNHCHGFGPDKQRSTIKFECTGGAAIVELGVLQNYPVGEPDSFNFFIQSANGSGHWQSKQIEGTWFPHAFVGSMRELMDTALGRKAMPDNNIDDALRTMACVEAAYTSSKQGGVQPNFNF